MSTGIHAELALSSCDGCPVAALSASTPVEEVRVDSTDDRVEFVAADPPDDPPTGLDLVEFGGRAHGRYEIECERPATDGGVHLGAPNSEEAPRSEPSSLDPSPTDPDGGICAGCSCGGLPAAFANFPVSPRRTEMVDGEIRVSFVLSGHEELRAIVDECEAVGLDVELRRLCVDRARGDGDEYCPDVVPVDLAGVTDRQAEIATVAAEKGYFETGGASAADVAAEFDLAKSTVSEHLRTVTAALFSQTFGTGDGT
ncbi:MULTISPECIES: helix-turn-helix domain-containing protein [unclassified Halorubrum]|uniref:helix-turn-helix domain-containing protein n=1 Tax=unclassified Halorubrum TaxID=2642239 RepID=UPI000B992A9B|nr:MULTISPECIES: helix-turn-helix domain-containing protein [unclassified Halorubrum]OYR45206.1 bacterio-opsin activator [Halorubrum sp. Eb13]OYR53623.1 bacterio-opsin activator [Halorubrum sp. Ea1]